MFDSYLLIANRIRIYIAEAGSEKPRDITKSTINYKNKRILFGKFDFLKEDSMDPLSDRKFTAIDLFFY